MKTKLTIEQHEKRYTILRRALGWYAKEANHVREYVDLCSPLECDHGARATAAIRKANNIKLEQT